MKGQGASHPGKRYDSEFKRESVRLADTSGKTMHGCGMDRV